MATDYRGYRRTDLTIAGRPAWLVTPATPAPGRPWLWRAEFWDHEPQVDLALLARGFHVAFIEVNNTFGCPDAMARWQAFYRHLTSTFGLAQRAALEGLSRGGLYCYNFAAAHPDAVACIYADNPVCDFKSWPGGQGAGPGSPGDWAKLLADYHFASEADALAWPHNPIDNLAPLAAARIPVLHVCGDADEVVPYAENSAILKDRYRALGGHYEEILKPGGKHHPHCLPDPAPIVNFLLRHAARG